MIDTELHGALPLLLSAVDLPLLLREDNERSSRSGGGPSADVSLQHELLLRNKQRCSAQRVGTTSVERVGWKAESLPPPSDKRMVSIVRLGEPL